MEDDIKNFSPDANELLSQEYMLEIASLIYGCSFLSQDASQDLKLNFSGQVAKAHFGL